MQKKTTRETSNRGRSSAAPVQGGGTRGNRRSERRTNVPSETRRPMKKRRIGTVVMSSSVNAKKKKVDRAVHKGLQVQLANGGFELTVRQVKYEYHRYRHRQATSTKRTHSTSHVRKDKSMMDGNTQSGMARDTMTRMIRTGTMHLQTQNTVATGTRLNNPPVHVMIRCVQSSWTGPTWL